MASTYTGLGTQLMTTGEKAGTWGTLTNTNWNINEQIAGGYIAVDINGGAQTTTLSVNDGTTGAALAHRVINFTGAITGNQIVTIPLDVQTFYIIKNTTTDATNAFTVQFKYVSGSGGSVTFAGGDRGTKIVYATANDGTNPDIIDATSSFSLTSPTVITGINDVIGNELIKVTATASAVNEFTIANAATGAGPTLSATGETNVDINITPKATGKIALDGIKWPNADGSADQIMTTNGSGVLSFVDNSGGTEWQAVDTTTFTAVAGEGYFCNTSGGAFTATLPASPSLGDEVSFIDYGATFDTANLTVGRNSEPIQGAAADLTVAVERAAFTLVYTDGTQGWLLKDK